MSSTPIDDLEYSCMPEPQNDDEPEMAAELRGLPILDDPTLVLHCARCRLSYEACRCPRGPVRWPEAVDEFELLHKDDADHD